MSTKFIVDACDFCTSLIKLNIMSLTDPDEAATKKTQLFDSVKSNHKELSGLQNEEIKDMLCAIYIKNIDNDKYGRIA